MVDGDVGIHRLLDEGDDVGRGDPGRAEAGRDVGGAKIWRLHPLERRDVADVRRVERDGGTCGGELGAHGAREIGVRCQPRAAFRIAEDRITKFIDHSVDIAVQELSDVLRVDGAALVEHHGKGVDGRGDDWRRRRRDHTLGEDRPRFRGIALEVVVLDRGDEPAIGIVREWGKVRPTVRFPNLAGLFTLDRRHHGGVDGSKVPHEARPGDAEPDLRLFPGLVCLLGLEDLTHGVADRD
ncbi:UNVERIFIED_ORG: hypothetical protein J2R74_009028 [Bradyrhizobium japonicum]